MADIELVIKIPEEIYIHLLSRYKYQDTNDIGLSESAKIGVAIKNGTPLPKEHGWIPVSERLPEDHENVLIWLKSNHITIGLYNSHKLPCDDRPIGWGVDAKISVHNFCSDDVLAWMPLPEPYEEYAKDMTYRDAVYNALRGKCIPYRKATLIKLYELLDRIEPKMSEIPTGSERSDKVNCDKTECYNCVNHSYCDYETESEVEE